MAKKIVYSKGVCKCTVIKTSKHSKHKTLWLKRAEKWTTGSDLDSELVNVEIFTSKAQFWCVFFIAKMGQKVG